MFAGCLRYGSNGRARLRAGLDNLQLELRAVEPALGCLAGASLARHGVHDIHRAHYLNLFAALQDGMTSLLRHSTIGFVTPAQRHAGLDRALLEERALVYTG